MLGSHARASCYDACTSESWGYVGGLLSGMYIPGVLMFGIFGQCCTDTEILKLPGQEWELSCVAAKMTGSSMCKHKFSTVLTAGILQPAQAQLYRSGDVAMVMKGPFCLPKLNFSLESGLLSW